LLAAIRLREGSDEQLADPDPAGLWAAEHYDAILRIGAAENTMALAGVDPARLALARRAAAPIGAAAMRRTTTKALRRTGTLFPTAAYAQQAGMTLDDYEEFVYRACLLHHDDPVAAWRERAASWQRIADFLAGRNELRIVAPGTDLTLRVGGRTWINSSGSNETGSINFPSGEVYTGPHEDSANGTIRFTHPAIYGGNLVEDVRLTFEAGRVVAATAARGQALLDGLLATDEGSRYLGEVAFGLHDGIDRFTGNILFDEKLGGTLHLALGQSYPASGGQNRSALHWDLICDLREGEVFADGERCYAAGRFLF
jgi:aminopeptidase